MNLRRNLLLGVTSSVWSALLAVAVVPFQIRYLGVEAYGLVGFYATLQVLLSLLDLGLAPTINREVARCRASGNLSDAGRLMHTMVWVYGGVAATIAALVAALAPWIATHWLQAQSLSDATLAQAVMLMGFVVACRWPIGLYQGALFGAERQDVVSAIAIGISTATGVGGVAMLVWVSPTIEAFLIWQLGIGLTHVLVLRRAAWAVVGRPDQLGFEWLRLRSVLKFSAGMSAIALSAVIFTQLDKVILSKMLSLEGFAHYMLATTVVSSLYLFIMPIFNLLYPRLSLLAAAGQERELLNLYRSATGAYLAVLFALATPLVVFSEELIYLWVRDRGLAIQVAPIVSVLAVGSALHGIMFFPYALQLAYGATRLPLMINGVLMVIMLPIIVFMSSRYGAMGGAYAWLVLHLLYVMLGTWLTHKHILRGLALKWLKRDVLPFLSIAVGFGLAESYGRSMTQATELTRLVIGAAMFWVMLACAWLLLREDAKSVIRKKFLRI